MDGDPDLTAMQVKTDMSLKEWEAYCASDFSLSRLLSLDVEDPALQGLVKNGVKAQIKADGEKYGWTRALKHWWNGLW
jgi:hypothetical protein